MTSISAYGPPHEPVPQSSYDPSGVLPFAPALVARPPAGRIRANPCLPHGHRQIRAATDRPRDSVAPPASDVWPPRRVSTPGRLHPACESHSPVLPLPVAPYPSLDTHARHRRE